MEKIKNIASKNKIDYEFKNNNNPDIDFIYMCNSKIFIKSGGGFSNIIGKIVKYRGGIVYSIHDFM